MTISPEYGNVFKWRYLESLDSTRYSPLNLDLWQAQKSIRAEQASIEVSAAILMGHGIIVPINQLIDSFGFLRIASEMIKAAAVFESKRKHIFLPLKYAFYDYHREPGGGPHLKNPYQLAAYIFNKDGSQNRGFFQLSAWPKLGARRTEWARVIREGCMAIPDRLIQHEDYYEQILAEDLIRILHFFCMNQNLIIDAKETTKDREQLVRYISNLSNEKIKQDNYLYHVVKSSKSPLLHLENIKRIARVFNKLEKKIIDGKSIIDNRSLIRQELIEHPENYIDGDSSTIPAIRIGVLETLDSIYNFTGKIATRADQENQSVPVENDEIWGYDEAAFALGQWARENHVVLNNQPSDETSANQDTYICPQLTDPSYVMGNFDDFWNNFFSFQSNEWFKSLAEYSKQLYSFEKMQTSYVNMDSKEKTLAAKKSLIERSKRYKQARMNHIELINTFLEKHKYRIEIGVNDNAVLVHYDPNGQMLSKIEIEDFAENPLLTKQERSALHAGKLAMGITSKGRIAEYNGVNE